MENVGILNMINRINKLYSLILNKFKFELDKNNLKVFPPDQISNPEKLAAKNFIYENKSLIIDILKNNKDLPPILHLSLLDSLVPLSFAQERLWFIEKYEQGTCAYNVPMVFELSGEADTRLFEQSISTIFPGMKFCGH